MTIDERIKEAKKKRNVAYKKDSVQGIVYWDGYLDALKEVAELEEKLAEVTANWQKIHDSYNADCIEHYNKGRSDGAEEIFEEIERVFDELFVSAKARHRTKDVYAWCETDGEITSITEARMLIAELKKKYTKEITEEGK